MEKPDFNKFLDAFNEKTLRPALAARKEKLDESLAAMPVSYLTRAVEDAYAQMANAKQPSLNVSLDPAAVVKSVEAMKTQLQKPVVSLLVAQGIKEFVNKNSSGSLESALFQAAPNASPEQLMIAQIVLAQLAPKLDELKNASVDDVAAQIRTGASKLSSEAVALQITALVQNAPSMMPQQSFDVTSKLPAPQTVAEAMQEVGKAASNALDNAAKGATFAETVSALKQFAANANDAVTRVLGNPSQPSPAVDKPVEKAPKKKGGKNWKL